MTQDHQDREPMNSRTPLSFATIKDAIGSFLSLCAATGVVWTMLWFALQPRLQPYLDVVVQIEAMATKIADNEARLVIIEESVPELQVLEYVGTAEVEPDEILPGGNITITYVQRRNFACAVTIFARFYSVDMRGYDVRLSYEFTGMRAPVVPEFGAVSIVLPIPETIQPGRWGYAPIIQPSEDCPSAEAILPPIAYFDVTAP